MIVRDDASLWRMARFGLSASLLSLILSTLTVAALAFPIIDVSGWWASSEGFMIEIRQQQQNLELYDIWGTWFGDGAVSNDSVYLFVGSDTIALIYSNDQLAGTDPGGGQILLHRSASGPVWREAGCRTITIDGQVFDWSGIAPLVDDADGDATGNPSTEIDKVFVSRDKHYLYLRVDIVGQANPQHSGHNGDRYSFELRTSAKSCEIAFYGGNVTQFMDFVSGGVTNLDPYGISAHTVEGRVPLVLLDGYQRAELIAESEFWHSDNDAGSFDAARCLLSIGQCTPCGDVDGSGEVLIFDVLYLVDWLFRNGQIPQDDGAGDINCDGRANIADVVYLVRYLYMGGPVPCAGCS